jgi:tetratricopeptide (TPR) repeat protein
MMTMSERFVDRILPVSMLVSAALGLGGCPPPQPELPDPTLIADPPPTEDGRLPGAGMSDLDRGMAYVKSEAYAEALPYLDRAVASQSENAEAQYYRALACERTGNLLEAEKGYRKAIEVDGRLVNARINLGALYLEDPPRPELAIEVLAPAAEYEPEAADVHLNLAFAYRLDKRPAEAEKHYLKALSLADDPNTRFDLADLLFEEGKLEQMVEELRKVLPAVAKDLKRVTVVAHRLAKGGAYEDCIKAFDYAVALDAKEPGYLVHRGLCKHGLKREDAARADFEAAIALDGSYQPAWYYLAQALLQSKRRQKATDAFEKAIKLGKDTPVGKKAREELSAMAAGR